MPLVRRPGISDIRTLDLRTVQGAVAATRQRIEAIEVAVNALQASTGASNTAASLATLTAQMAQLTSTVNTLLAATNSDRTVYRADAAVEALHAVYATSDGGVSQVDLGDPTAVYAPVGVAVIGAAATAQVTVQQSGYLEVPGAVFESGGPVFAGVDGLTQRPDYTGLVLPLGVAVGTDAMWVAPGWPAVQSPGVYSDYELFLPVTLGLVRETLDMVNGLLMDGDGVVSKIGNNLTTEAGVASTTFTPEVTFATPGDLSVSYATQVGQYVRVGKLVFFKIRLTFTPTHTTASGEFRIAGMPFRAELTGDAAIPVAHINSAFTFPASVTQVVARLPANALQLRLYGHGSGIASTVFTTTHVPSGTAKSLSLSGCYITE